MRSPFNADLKSLFTPTLISALLFSMAGCNSEDDRRYDPPPTVPPTVHTSPAVSPGLTSAPATSAQLAPPLRRTAQTSQSENDGISGFELDAKQDVVGFQATKTPAGTVVHAHGLVASDDQLRPALAELGAIGFKADGAAGSPIWTTTISADGRPAFDTRLATELQAVAHRIDAAANRLRRNQPGRLLKSDDTPGFLPRRLVYTGQPLDIAFADTAGDPRWFIAVKPTPETRAYLRGGRLFVAEDGTLRIEKYALAAELPAVPKDTEQLKIGADGRVTALRRDGMSETLGRLPLVSIAAIQNEKVTLNDDGAAEIDGEHAPSPDLATSDAPVRAGHLEYPAPDRAAELKKLAAELSIRRALEALSVTLANPAASAKAGDEPVVIYADLPWSERQLKALGIPVEHSTGHTTLMMDGDPHKLSAALAKVLQVLRVRMSLHEQNLRNADRLRDADNRLNPYRRKTLTIDAQGEAVEGDDPAPFPKTFKPGDPNADAEGFINLPNVNRAVETAEFQAAREEYKLIRAAAERLEPHSIFPDPPNIPVKE